MQKPFTLEEFRAVYSKVPRATVEIIVKNERGILLTLRKIKPHQGLWHIPGGTILFKETIHKAAWRIANEELGVGVMIEKYLGYIEYLHEEDDWFDHAIGHAFLCRPDRTNFSVEEQASEYQFFNTLPTNMVLEQKEFLKKLFNL